MSWSQEYVKLAATVTAEGLEVGDLVTGLDDNSEKVAVDQYLTRGQSQRIEDGV